VSRFQLSSLEEASAFGVSLPEAQADAPRTPTLYSSIQLQSELIPQFPAKRSPGWHHRSIPSPRSDRRSRWCSGWLSSHERLSDRDCPQNIIGFFTLTLCEVRSEKLPSEIAKKYPSQVPGVKLARLAVAKQWQRQGIGEILIVEAMQRALLVADTAGGIGLFVDAKDESAQSYYARYGFITLEDNPLEMFLPLSVLRTLNLATDKG
jgi:GNAT superfamily N-acetyltransferase